MKLMRWACWAGQTSPIAAGRASSSEAGVVQHAVAVLALQRICNRQRGHGRVTAHGWGSRSRSTVGQQECGHNVQGRTGPPSRQLHGLQAGSHGRSERTAGSPVRPAG